MLRHQCLQSHLLDFNTAIRCMLQWRQLKHPDSYSSGRNMASLERQSSDDEFLNCQTSAAPLWNSKTGHIHLTT
ncbi:hypothetical protein ACLKA6_010187 [Drosophila palustris]